MTKCRSCGFENALRVACAACGAELTDSAVLGRSAAGVAREPEILRLLRNGQKIQAIKLHREATSLGLKESKEAVEALARRHGIVNQPSLPGMGVLFLLLAVALSLLWVFLR